MDKITVPYKAALPDLLYKQALILCTVILFTAFFIRIYDLAHTPPGVPFDAMDSLADSLRISQGIPFPLAFGSQPEPVYRYIIAGWFILTGPYVFTALVFNAFVSIFTVALAYLAGLLVLDGFAWRRLGSLVAAAAMAAITPHVYLSRAPYRAILLPPVVLATLIILLVAYRSKRKRDWALGGLLAGCGLHTYLAGIITPFWALGLIGHQLLIPERGKRLSWRQAGFAILGMMPPVLIWLALFWLIPGLLARVEGAGKGTALGVGDILAGLWGTIRAYALTGHFQPIYNTENTPFLNPPLALLALAGTALLLPRWRRPEGVLLLGGLLLFSLPAALSEDPTNPVRLSGAMPLVSLLSGVGAAGIARWSRLKKVRIPLTIGLVAVSIVATHLAYQGMFVDPYYWKEDVGPWTQNPDRWLKLPHNYTVALIDAMQSLEKVDQPTYVPLWILDNPVGAFFLQRKAFPNVTTWSRHPLKELPAGQYFMPTYGYYHVPVADMAVADRVTMALLLPAEKTMVILPTGGVPTSISDPIKDSSAGVTAITNERGWTVARVKPVPRADFSPPLIPPPETLPAVGSGLRLITAQPFPKVQSGETGTVLLTWLITAPQRADVSSVLQLISPDFNARAGDYHPVLSSIFPSARWQPGDVIPDAHLITIPDHLPDGIYRWGAGTFVPPGMKRQPVTIPPGPDNMYDAGPQLQDLWLWDAVSIPKERHRLMVLPPTVTPIDVHLGTQIRLVGYHVEQHERTWTVKLYWQADTQPMGDYTIFVHAEASGKLIAQSDQKPQNGELPTWAWQPGELVETTQTLNLVQDTPAPDTLYVGMYSYPSLVRLQVFEDGNNIQDRRVEIWSYTTPPPESSTLNLPADIAPGTYELYVGWYRYPDMTRLRAYPKSGE
jgi:hypothetical protein